MIELDSGGGGWDVVASKDRRRKSEDFDHFCPFGRAPSSTVVRWESTVPVSLLIDCRGSTSITGVTQGVWEEDLCGCGGVTMVGGCHGECLVVFDESSN